MAWTSVPKPTGTGYTKLSPLGNEFFDDSTVTFDSATVFFNGVNNSAWTSIANPKQPLGVNQGMTMGLLMPLTESRNTRTNDPWTRITKPQ